MAVNIVLISTYELGRQPFGLASPAAWLRKRGQRVVALDLARQSLDEAAIGDAGLIAIYLPMHTATRLAAQLIPQLRKQNPRAHLCCYGLYAPMNVDNRDARVDSASDRKSTRLNSSHVEISYAVFCLKKKK